MMRWRDRYTYVEALRRQEDSRSTERFAFLLAGGVFAWKEIQRRLEGLNHEAARISAVQEKSVSADTYIANEEQRKGEAARLLEWQREVDSDRTQSINREEFQRETKRERSGSITTATAIVVATVALVGLLLGWQQSHRHNTTVTVPTVLTQTVTTTVTTTAP